MRAIVTGCAGFIGSTLTDRLLASGIEVIGVDSFTDYYDPAAKRYNLADACESENFELLKLDLATDPLDGLNLGGVDVVYHLAGQPGVRSSWRDGFAPYLSDNVLATQRLLDAVVQAGGGPRFVYGSSSSVYGAARRFPVEEGDLPAPLSPYGVTKLSGEHLADLYARNFHLSVVSLRFFTVYGPRQRPDMAIRRLIDVGIDGGEFPMFGDGRQVRDFTYVGDIVDGLVAAGGARFDRPEVANLAGGCSVSLRDLIATVEAALDRPIRVRHLPPQPGDPARTSGCTAAAQRLLDWRATHSVEAGIEDQVAWQLSARAARCAS